MRPCPPHERAQAPGAATSPVAAPAQSDDKDGAAAAYKKGWGRSIRCWPTSTAATGSGSPCRGAAAVEITDALDLTQWPCGARVIVRREPLHPGAQQTLDDIDGHRFTALLTDRTDADIATLEQRHRAHARVEDRIRGAKDSGLRNLPCDTFERNAVCLQLIMAGQDLMTFAPGGCRRCRRQRRCAACRYPNGGHRAGVRTWRG